MMMAKTVALVVVLAVATVGAAVYLPTLGRNPTSATSRTSTGSTSCTTSGTSGTDSTVLVGSFTANPNTPVRVDFVRAALYPDSQGGLDLRFEAGFTNVGPTPVYVVAGCGSSLTSTITSGEDVVKTVGGTLRCLCAEGPAAVNASQSRTAVDPGCWSGYYYKVQHSGGFSAQLTLSWSDDPQLGSETGHVTVAANFTVP